jgi:hypothetical protein
MIEFWTNLAYTTKFSVIGFVVSLVLGLLSMGALGGVLYYPVSFLFRAYPTLNEWTGDWVWPAVIGVGMAWSFGFLMAGTAWYYLDGHISSVIVLRVVYGLILWGWAALLWYIVIKNNAV